MKKNDTHSYCLSILNLGSGRRKALVNFIMGLASSPNISHPVEISESPFCHYTYSNLTKIVKYWNLKDETMLSFLSPYFPEPLQLACGRSYYTLAHDFTKLSKPHSATLEGRGYLLACNPVTNISLTAGYPISALHIHGGHGGFMPPLLMERLSVDADKNAQVLSQLDTVLTHADLPLKACICLFLADSGYGKAKIMSALYEYTQVAGILRMRSGMKVWAKYEGEQKQKGTARIYGGKYYLSSQSCPEKNRKSITECPGCEAESYEHTLSNGRVVIVHLKRWNNMMIRSQKACKMKDKPLDIVEVVITDKTTGKRVFARPMFLAITGKEKSCISTRESHSEYRKRFDVEGSYRFMNQNLLMGSFQSPELRHQDTYLKMVQLTYWLLFVASQELTQVDCKPWQKYDKKHKAATQAAPKPLNLTPAQTQKSIWRLFATFDKKPFLPKKCKKSKGRKPSTTFPQRPHYKVVKKTKVEKKKPEITIK
jgi:hypothetical protein